MLLTLVALAVVVVSVTGARSHIRLPGFRVPRSDAPRQGASSPSPVESRQEEVARFDFLTWSHRLLVNDLPRTMSRLSFWGSLTLVALVAASSALVSDRQDRDSLMGVVTTSAGGIAAPPHGAYPFLYSWVDFLVAASLALTLYTIRKAGSWAPLRATLNNIADVAGFWPRSIAPWGARSYRQTVCESLARAIAIEGTKDVVLVGHSQGSVIAAWLVAHRSEFGLDPPRGLVTCGSPLQSLYARLFPSHVGEALYGRIADEGVPWVNCWRSTDPIAAPIAAGTVRNLKLADGPGSAAGEWQGHSEYWVNVRQQAAIRRLLGYSQPGWRG
jgi:pimeloyl-ACP methyl ester carboxylesterase